MPANLASAAVHVLSFIIDHKRRHDGVSPTIREIKEGVGYKSTSNVSYWLQRLEKSRNRHGR